MGARVQIDPNVNCNTWSSIQSFGEWMKQECRTLQTYGGIIVDTGEGVVSQYYLSTAGYQFPWNSVYGTSLSNTIGLPTDLMQRFRVIDWTRWTGQ